jgi:hypothetical protein
VGAPNELAVQCTPAPTLAPVACGGILLHVARGARSIAARRRAAGELPKRSRKQRVNCKLSKGSWLLQISGETQNEKIANSRISANHSR